MVMSEKVKNWRDLLEPVRQYRRKLGNSVGGSLHIVLDDPNYRDRDVEFCLQYAHERGDIEGEALARLLLGASVTQRRKLAAHYHEQVEGIH